MCCFFQQVDLYTVTEKDLDFTQPFHLILSRNDYMQAIVTFFRVEFTKCHKRTGFSTGKCILHFRLHSVGQGLANLLSWEIF